MAPLEEEPADHHVGPGDLPGREDHRRPRRLHDDPGTSTAACIPDYLVGKGILQQSQIDGGYDGTPARFVADDGKVAQQGFASAEPYIYENEVPEWGKPVAYQLIHDTGLEIYSQTMATRPENVTKFADCFKKLVPIMQQATSTT